MQKSHIDKIAFLFIKDRKILVTLSKGKDTWYLPGGKREKGETDKHTLIREIKEELNIDIIPKTIKYYGTFKAQAHGKPLGVLVQMTCYTADFDGKIKADSEIERIDFFTSSTKNSLSPVDYIIFADLKNKNLID